MHFPAESKVWESDGRRNSRLVDKEQEYCGQGSSEALPPLFPLSILTGGEKGRKMTLFYCRESAVRVYIQRGGGGRGGRRAFIAWLLRWREAETFIQGQ